MRISDWSSDVCSSDLLLAELGHQRGLVFDQHDFAVVDDADAIGHLLGFLDVVRGENNGDAAFTQRAYHLPHVVTPFHVDTRAGLIEEQALRLMRSEEHTSDLRSLMRISYAAFCLKQYDAR